MHSVEVKPINIKADTLSSADTMSTHTEVIGHCGIRRGSIDLGDFVAIDPPLTKAQEACLKRTKKECAPIMATVDSQGRVREVHIVADSKGA